MSLKLALILFPAAFFYSNCIPKTALQIYSDWVWPATQDTTWTFCLRITHLVLAVGSDSINSNPVPLTCTEGSKYIVEHTHHMTSLLYIASNFILCEWVFVSQQQCHDIIIEGYDGTVTG